MKRRFFLKIALASTALPVAALTPQKANAFAITLAAVAKVASIGSSVLGAFSRKSNPTPQLVLQNYNLLLGVHEKLDSLEKLIIEVLQTVNAIPEVLQREIDAGLERAANKEILAIVSGHKEALTVFEDARTNGTAEAAYPILLANAQQSHNDIRRLRNELSFYSAYSLMAIAASAVTELSLYILQGGEAASYGVLRQFNRQLLEKHENSTIEGTLAHDLAGLETRFHSAQQTVKNYLAAFPPEPNADIELVDRTDYLSRCTTYGYPERPWGQYVRGGQQGFPVGYLNLNRIFRRHEEGLDRAKDRRRDNDSLTFSYVAASEVTLNVDTFEAGGQTLLILRVPDRPEVAFSGGEFPGLNCYENAVIGRPNVNDAEYQQHVSQLFRHVASYNSLAEAYGVMLEYRKQVRESFAKLDDFLDELGVPA